MNKRLKSLAIITIKWKAIKPYVSGTSLGGYSVDEHTN